MRPNAKEAKRLADKRGKELSKQVMAKLPKPPNRKSHNPAYYPPYSIEMGPNEEAYLAAEARGSVSKETGSSGAQAMAYGPGGYALYEALIGEWFVAESNGTMRVPATAEISGRAAAYTFGALGSASASFFILFLGYDQEGRLVDVNYSSTRFFHIPVFNPQFFFLFLTTKGHGRNSVDVSTMLNVRVRARMPFMILAGLEQESVLAGGTGFAGTNVSASIRPITASYA